MRLFPDTSAEHSILGAIGWAPGQIDHLPSVTFAGAVESERTMKLVPSPAEPPLAYPDRGAFKRPRGQQTFSDVVRRLRLFSQESLVTLGTRILWTVYRQPELLDEGQPQWMGRNIAALFAERLVALACIHANNYRPAATEREFDLLCWELHNSADEELTNLGAETQVAARISSIENQGLRVALERVPRRALLVEAFRARTAAFHIAGRFEGLPALIRPMLIAEHLCRLLDQRCGAAATQRLRHFLQGSVTEFFRNGMVLNGLLFEGISLRPANGGPPVREFGVAHLDDGPVGDAELKALGVTGEGLRAFGLRLSRTLDNFATLRDELVAVPEAERKYSQQINWLGRWPLLDMGVRGSARRLVAPSPRGFAMSLERFLLYEMPKTLVSDGLTDLAGRNLDANNVTSLRGEAYAAYLGEVLLPHGAVNADELADVVGKRPDFIWVGEKCGLLIEAKFSLLPNDDRALSNVSAAITSWERAYDALEQATQFVEKNRPLLSSRWPGVKEWLPVVVVHDALPDETTRFKAVAKRAAIKRECVASMALVSTGELERWVRASSADHLCAEAKRVWDGLDPNAVSDDLLLDPPPEESADVPPHIRGALSRILPGSKFERIGAPSVRATPDRQ